MNICNSRNISDVELHLCPEQETDYEIRHELCSTRDASRSLATRLCWLERFPGHGTDSNDDPGPTSKQSFGIPADRAQTNFTDPESRNMKTSNERAGSNAATPS